MNIKELENKSNTLFDELVSTLESELNEELRNLTEIKWMKSKVKSFNTIYVHHDWSGWSDGDGEYSIITCPYNDADIDNKGLENICIEMEHKWTECPEDNEIEELENLSLDDLYTFFDYYIRITSLLERYVEISTPIGKTMMLKLD